ncbi:acetyl-coenzyme A synthetase [Trichophyton equinum CBS 127.97]|uniref:acetate--CoA ligase n=1 Tax=Trichophyton equinum (strain ATCC MYA-4606 / CBS 127.97) TaxID=559882 RepID=F2PSQ9_TRIEC|nr:acetyl-coenzyme A synthetase [Trichophyton equinum CBS 127.97]
MAEVDAANAPVVVEAHQVETVGVPEEYHQHSTKTHLKSFEEYKTLYEESISSPDTFWARLARELVTFDKDFNTTHIGSFKGGDNAWFVGGRLSASYNCVDRHALKNPDKVAIIYEADEPGEGRSITYGELLKQKIVDEALKQCPGVTSCIVFKRTGAEVPWTQGRDLWWHEEVKKYPSYIAPESMDSEDPLFLLYTSGSTGKPKGVMHTTAGYLVGAAATGKYVFDIHEEDRFFCGGDVGWITGHTYVVYAPLLLGATTVVFESTPAYPNFSRYWDVIEKNKVTQFYVAPTALRLLKRAGDQHIHHEMKDLRVLGSVGEPIAAEIWKWYYEVVGKKKAQVVDTYWQTETGSHVITPLGGITPTKPGSASLPFFGIEPAIVDPVTGEELKGNDVEGVLAFKQPWPSMARTVWGAHKRYMDTYFNVYPGFYFTGDGAGRDHDGYYWIRGRVDDVVNVSGHRLSTAEIEAALITHASVAEAAVVGVHDELTGQAVNAFVALKTGNEIGEEIRKELVLQVRKSIGPFAAPKAVYVVEDLPKTRSGKIMRRILRKILSGEADSLGDISTLSDPTVVPKIIEMYEATKKN